ncbi:MAG: hypothetical protein PHN88_03680 [Ignavibacteria bacterium]|nr:hypothetical protein [Ignavibacteria bacterium]
MKKKHIIILLSTLIIGIIIGGLAMGIYSHKRMNSYMENPTPEKLKSRNMHMLDPDVSQLKQIEPILDKYSVKAYNALKENEFRMYTMYDSLYQELKPLLNETQQDKFEKKLNRIKTKIGK